MNRLPDLLEQYFDARLDADGGAELRDILAHDPAARRAFWQEAELRTQLEVVHVDRLPDQRVRAQPDQQELRALGYVE